MAGYSKTAGACPPSAPTLAGKLGIKAGAHVLLDGAPNGFDLGPTPQDVTVSRRVGRRAFDVVVCFCSDHARLVRRWPLLHPATTPAGYLWVAWPKRASGVSSDLGENVVRDFALAHGRVDVKVCAIDEHWSGLGHVIRKEDR